MASQLTLRLGGLGFGAPPCSDMFSRLDILQERAMKLNSLAVDAWISARCEAYAWLIREYRRKRLVWNAEAATAKIDEGKRAAEWDMTPGDYALYLDRCRESFGLLVRHRLAPLQGADERREALIAKVDQEIDADRDKYDPFYFPNAASQRPSGVTDSTSKDANPEGSLH